MRGRGNKANRDKMSILADAKNLLCKLIPMFQRMPKIERMDGAPVMMKTAVCGIIECYTVAYNCPEARREYIQRMFGHYGLLIASFDILINQGLLTDSNKLAVCESLDRIEEGVKKWHRSLPTSGSDTGRREYKGVMYAPSEEVSGSNQG